MLLATRAHVSAIKSSQFLRIVAIQAYCRYRMLGNGKAESRRKASTDTYLHPKHAGVIKSEFKSILATDNLRKQLSGGNCSKQALILSGKMDAMREWLRAQPRGTVKPHSFANWLSRSILQPALAAESSERQLDDASVGNGATAAAQSAQAARKHDAAIVIQRTAKRWLRALDWVYATDTKGAYTDGKFREDVIAARDQFIRDMDQLAPRMRTMKEDFMSREAFEALNPDLLASIVTGKDGNEVLCGKDCELCGGGKEVLVSRIQDPSLPAGSRLLVPVYHDECTFMASDGKTVFWMPKWSHSLKKKSRGKGIMVSSFVCECHGELRFAGLVERLPTAASLNPSLSNLPRPRNVIEVPDMHDVDPGESDDEDDDVESPTDMHGDVQGSNGGDADGSESDVHDSGDSSIAGTPSTNETTARVLFEYGKNSAGYWTSQGLYNQVVDQLLPVFEAMHDKGPNGEPCQGLFIFDNAAGHKNFADNALIARNLNLGDGGQTTPLLRNTSFAAADGTVVPQLMQVEGKQKGVKTILTERRKWPANNKCPDGKPFRLRCKLCKGALANDSGRAGRSDSCALRLLECEPDLVAQKSLIAEVIMAAGHLTLFLPKFHHDFNRASSLHLSVWHTHAVDLSNPLSYVCTYPCVAIERLWSAAKYFARENCGYSFTSLRVTVPKNAREHPHFVYSTVLSQVR